MKSMKKLASVCVLLAGMGISAESYALSCQQIQTLGNALSSHIEREINQEVAGFTQRINRRKTLVVHNVHSTSFTGCDLQTKLRVTLQRKIRRNAHGNVTLKARVASFNGNRVCLSNVRVTNVDLSRTLGIGEWFYRQAANKAIPNNQCFNL